MKWYLWGTVILFYSLFGGACSSVQTYDLSAYGLSPAKDADNAPAMARALGQIREKCMENEVIVVTMPKGRYEFYPDSAAERVYFISNHDQMNPKKVGLPFEGMKNIIFDGQGSEFIFHGRMLPVSLSDSRNCVLKNFSIDFQDPQISQVRIIENDTIHGGITFEVAPWVQYEIKDSVFIAKGRGWSVVPQSGIAFEEESRHLVYNTSDIPVGMRGVAEISPRIIKSARWNDKRLLPGTVVALRSWERPAPGIFMYHDVNTTLENIQVHYAEGMGLLAQMSENITLDRFSVCLRGEEDPRYFTTQADATHFSACKGEIISRNGLYEGMMDDAINVHGTYLKVVSRVDDRTLIGRYMHPQTYGFEWGRAGDSVQFIQSRTMELIGEKNQITSIKAVDQPDYQGAKEFEIRFKDKLNPSILAENGFGIENLEWTPSVLFSDNLIRNNRARGSLFSTPRQTIIENNVFDHTSGTAILLCGDCNGWFETGACRNVLIRKNKFINSLTNMFQFTNAIISIYPEIPDLAAQRKYFHSNIVIDANEFFTFDRPLVYAKSVDGLIFTNNIVKQNTEYPAFHWNNHRFYFQRVIRSEIRKNYFEQGFTRETDVLEEK
ncbi:right-handed parallel beta-helix repeat-containing protein [uncultured Parabacteroides sp.]|uniref:right-handed parallel beta-helix repeat-containing protein n=1 Tax=uncultured Parabacteroides sp. TaxID=512312 RepID=UPI00262FABAD|nr:right-handed parallel beta-helix repeat-containing protein [uncultured Parabacteroides sp.]